MAILMTKLSPPLLLPLVFQKSWEYQTLNVSFLPNKQHMEIFVLSSYVFTKRIRQAISLCKLMNELHNKRIQYDCKILRSTLTQGMMFQNIIDIVFVTSINCHSLDKKLSGSRN
jgi:hypothetical protein